MTLFQTFFSTSGRLNRREFLCGFITVCSLLLIAELSTRRFLFVQIPSVMGLIALWSLVTVIIKRCRDLGRTNTWLAWLLVPVAGPIWIFGNLIFRRGSKRPKSTTDVSTATEYMQVEDTDVENTVNDVTRLNPISVRQVIRPKTTSEIRDAVCNSTLSISVGGGRFSMGGQTAGPQTLHFDMRTFNQVLDFQPAESRIRIQSGARWCDIQAVIDPHDLAISIMQTYANFTVGGALSVNGHGRYVGAGPLISSVRSIQMVLADGTIRTASPNENSELFYGAIGGYGGLGIITEVELNLTRNSRVMMDSKRMTLDDYSAFFQSKVRNNSEAVFHNADIYPPHYRQVRATTWTSTDRPVTEPCRLKAPTCSFSLDKYAHWAISEMPTGKWRREHLLDPLLFLRPKVHWRNFEAGYDVACLEPESREHSTYVLQEYFVPVRQLLSFVPRMAEIFQRHNVNVINVSIRHATADPGSLLAWAKEEVFALVVYYKQSVSRSSRSQVGVWTREIINAALQCGGTYYLPYQPHATTAQFQQAYPRSAEYFELKQQLDPECRFTSAFWDRYYKPNRITANSVPT